MRLWKKLLYAFILVNLLAMVFVTFILPGIIKNKAIEWVEANTERSLRIANLHLNPLNWEAAIDDFVLTEAESDKPFVSFSHLSFHVSPRSIWERAPVVTGLEIEEPKIAVVRQLDGGFNFSDLQALGKADESAPAVETEGGGPPRFALNNLVIRDGEISFIDQSKPDVTHTIRDLDLALPFLGNTPALADRFVEPHLSMKIDDAPIVASGGVKPFSKSLSTSLGLQLNNIDLPFYAAYLPDVRRFKIESGHLALDLQLSYRLSDDGVPELILNGSTTLTALRVRDQRDMDLFFLPLLRVSLDRASLFSREIAISGIDIYNLELFVDRGRDGVWNHARLANDPAFRSGPARSDPEAESASGPPPRLTVAAVRLRDGTIHFSDQQPAEPFSKTISNIDFDLEQVSLEKGAVSPFKLALQIDEAEATRTGRVEVAGDVELQPFSLKAHLAGRKIQLAGTEVYRPQMLAAYFASGHIDTDLDLLLQTGGTSPLVRLGGEVGVRGLRVREPVLKSDVLAWENLQLTGLQFEQAAGPPRLQLKELVLNSFLAKVLITRAGEVNLQHAVKTGETVVEGEPEAVAVDDSEVSAKVEEGSSSAQPQIMIETVVLQDGTFSFIDEHMQRPFNMELAELGGRISGLDSTQATPAEVDLRGSLNKVSPLKILGGLQPFGEGLFADFKIRFDAIDLTQATPYSGTYLGYTIEKGQLYLDLDYKIDGAELNAANKLFLDQFTFGDKVESDKATGLPVRLAVALLKDRAGEIHLDLPVSGSLNDPQFSVVGVTFTIIKNILVKAITSPFALLASLIPGGDEDFSAVYFEPGYGELSQAEQAKLAKLAAALNERPGLRVEVSGYIDPERDPEGFRQAELLRRLQAAAGGADLQGISQLERSRALKKVYQEADFPKPRNVLGLIKGLPDEEMEKLILANTAAGDAEMQQLADLRAKQVVDNLVQVQKMPPERVFLKRDDITKQGDADDDKRARVGFGVGVD